VRESEDQAEEVILEIEKKDIFTFDIFEKSFFNEQSNITVLQYFDTHIESLIQQGRVGNADIYKGTRNELSRFRKKKDFTFDDVNYSFLNQWEAFLARTNRTNSIGIHMRTLRAAFNKAIKDGIVSEASYPFKSYRIKKEAPLKRALLKEHIEMIYEYRATLMSKEWLAQQYFLFSYFCQGMSFADMAHLKWDNIMNGRIYYKRIKTIRTSQNPKVISIKITEFIEDILAVFRKQGSQADDYIFPILKKGMQPVTIKNTIRSKRKKFNHNLRKVCREVGIDKNITSYVARHTYAMVLKRNGIPTPVISQLLSHPSEASTQHYLSSFEDEVLDKANEGLL
jgi:integrase